MKAMMGFSLLCGGRARAECPLASDMWSTLPSLIIHYLLFTRFTAPVVNAGKLLWLESAAPALAGRFLLKAYLWAYMWSLYNLHTFNVLTNQFISIPTARCWK